MSIKQQIEELPEHKQVFLNRINAYIGNGTPVNDLKALAASHTRLLGDGRRALLSLEHFKECTATDPRVEERYEALKEAIEEAESL